MPHAARPRVLIAEDDDILRKLIAAIVSRCDCDVETAADGLEAVEHLQHGVFDVLVLDLMMPKMSGYDVIPVVREIKQRPAVLVLTAMAGERYLQLDADVVTAVMHKPFDTDFFEEMLTTFAGQLAQRRSMLDAGENPMPLGSPD